MAERLTQVVKQLAARYGKLEPPPITDPFELVLLENVSYLVNDDHRLKAFENLRRAVGIRPEDILSADPAQFETVIALAGSDKKGRVAKLITSAEIAMREFNGDVRSILDLPYKKAVSALERFPSIGRPGAEKILLFCGIGEVLPLDSNGLRVLLRLGFGEDSSNYNKVYKSVRGSTGDHTQKDNRWLISAHLLLRKHGQMTCKSNHPECDTCPIIDLCNFGQMAERKIYVGRS